MTYKEIRQARIAKKRQRIAFRKTPEGAAQFKEERRMKAKRWIQNNPKKYLTRSIKQDLARRIGVKSQDVPPEMVEAELFRRIVKRAINKRLGKGVSGVWVPRKPLFSEGEKVRVKNPLASMSLVSHKGS